MSSGSGLLNQFDFEIPQRDVKFKYRKPPLPPMTYSKKIGAKKQAIIFSGGFMSEREEDELGEYIEEYAIEKGYGIYRYDYADIGGSVWKTMQSPGGNPFNLTNLNTNVDEAGLEKMLASMPKFPTSMDEIPPENLEKSGNFDVELTVATTHLDPKLLSFNNWVQDLNGLIEEVTESEILLVGFDMGAWISLLMAVKFPQKVIGVVGISTSFDFMPRLWAKLSESEKKEVDKGEAVWLKGSNKPNDFLVTKKLLDESKKHHLKNWKNKIPVKCPCRFVHYFKDKYSPYPEILQMIERLETEDTEIETLNQGDHGMTSRRDLQLVCQSIDAIMQVHEDEKKLKNALEKSAEQKVDPYEEIRRELRRKERELAEEDRKKKEDERKEKKIEQERLEKVRKKFEDEEEKGRIRKGNKREEREQRKREILAAEKATKQEETGQNSAEGKQDSKEVRENSSDSEENEDNIAAVGLENPANSEVAAEQMELIRMQKEYLKLKIEKAKKKLREK